MSSLLSSQKKDHQRPKPCHEIVSQWKVTLTTGSLFVKPFILLWKLNSGMHG